MLVLSPPLFHIKLPHQTHIHISNIHKAKSQVRLQCNKIYWTSFPKKSFMVLLSFPPLPGFAGEAVVGRRGCEVVGRTVRGVKAGAAGWGAPCPNQGASPALPPWDPWETARMCATLPLPLRNLGKGKDKVKRERQFAPSSTRNSWCSVGSAPWKNKHLGFQGAHGTRDEAGFI